MLALATDLQLPLTAQTETFAILAQRGAGKSNTAAVMAEEMYACGLQFVVIDPVGAWWGLRAGGLPLAGGKPQPTGLPIPVFGGKHGDVPLTRTSGTQLADLVVTKRLTAVIDLSTFESEAAKKQFLLDFARRLYQTNEQPLHLFLEEADDYIPQRPMRDEAHLLRAFENLVRRGRARGIGLTLITQRSASLNKSVLTQVGTLFAMRTTGPHDRAAVEEWVKYHLDSKEFLKSLPELKTGEAWVWSPSFLQRTVRVQIRQRYTFDSGATPSKTSQASTLADINLDEVRAQLAEVIEQAEKDDPAVLRKEIAKLKQENAQLRLGPTVPPEDLRRLADLDRLLDHDMPSAIEHAVDNVLQQTVKDVADTVLRDGGTIVRALCLRLQQRALPSAYKPVPQFGVSTGRMKTGVEGDGTRKVTAVRTTPDDLDAAQRRILTTVVMLEARGLQPTRDLAAHWMGIHPNGGRYNTNLGFLRANGYLEERSMTLTERGRKATDSFETGIVPALRVMEDDAQRKLMELIARKPGMTREEAAEELGIHPNGGRFNTNLGHLRKLGVITERGPLKPTEAYFR